MRGGAKVRIWYGQLFVMPHVDTDFTCLCLKFDTFITARIDATIILI